MLHSLSCPLTVGSCKQERISACCNVWKMAGTNLLTCHTLCNYEWLNAIVLSNIEQNKAFHTLIVRRALLLKIAIGYVSYYDAASATGSLRPLALLWVTHLLALNFTTKKRKRLKELIKLFDNKSQIQWDETGLVKLHSILYIFLFSGIRKKKRRNHHYFSVLHSFQGW